MNPMSLKYEARVTGLSIPQLRRNHLLWLALLLLPLLSVAAALYVQQRGSDKAGNAPAPPSAPAASRVGEPAPALALPRLADGSVLSADSLRGRPLIVNFWASWCEPCVRELPALETFAARHSGAADPQVLAVNVGEEDATIRRFLAENEVASLMVLLDRDLVASDAWGARGLPMTFLVDPTGHVRAVQAGEITLAALEYWLFLMKSWATT
ncbi:MAG: TlpA disulfide reductase family protein [Anaerolineaceae bacterium]|nr:TlpA disulfide reductase family protein [Anaerolineaceae bacterium]